MAQQSNLMRHMQECHHPACRATDRLLRAGAGLRLGMGRHCELAVVAAAGAEGLDASDVVAARREYAKHLGVRVVGSVANAETPIHVEHALVNYRGNPAAKYPINLGSARAVKRGSRFSIRFDRAHA